MRQELIVHVYIVLLWKYKNNSTELLNLVQFYLFIDSDLPCYNLLANRAQLFKTNDVVS